MERYRRLSLMEREELSRGLTAGHSLRATAQAMQRAPSTLSRELAKHRTTPVTYRAVPAHQREQRWTHRPRKPRKLVVQPRLRTAVFTLLAHRWSPEQIARGLPQRYPDEPTMRISHEAIYTSVCAALRSLEAGTRPVSPSPTPLSSAAQGAPLVAAHSGPYQY